MRLFFVTAFLFVFFSGNAQVQLRGARSGSGSDSDSEKKSDTIRKSLRGSSNKDKIAPIDQYRIINLERDTTYFDTSLTIKKEYAHNYLRKDTFGLLPFANEGQTYMTLDRSKPKRLFPQAGYSAKMFAFYQPEDVDYYSVATPVTELYFKTTMEQGQSVDAFLTVNVNPNFNFSLAYKGLRSIGKYINQLSSTGNFRFTTSYSTKSKRYILNSHYMSFDFLNGENGGLINIEDFESEDDRFKNRARLDVYMRDAKSFIKGKRVFFDHSFRVNANDVQNNLSVFHQFNYENQYYEYNQATLGTAVPVSEGSTTTTTIQRFGTSYKASGINDQAHYNKMYNKAGIEFENKTIGHFKAFIEDFRYNYYFGRILITEDNINDGTLSGDTQTLGGTYFYKKGNWNGEATLSNSVAGQSTSLFNAKASYQINEKNKLKLEYLRQSSIPDHIYNLQQSSYVNYNWSNDFRNEKRNAVSAEILTQWVNASAYISNTTDKLYFANTSDDDNYQLIKPFQYEKSIQYISVRANREFKFWKLALDNTLLFQQVQQDDPIMNVPKFVTRNTLYFQNHFFKKALLLQTGVTFNYFTKFYADDFNPVINEFFVQSKKEIGGYPMLDFFLDARIKTCRIYFKLEHFNSAWTGNDYLTAPNYPYRDFMIRFGLEWNFFK
ncbi:putative porin [Flavobacterium silvaticum]|uniref:Porin n=1 Tax=Flavobacterium silvaticum TaxID=1852020 RepID=A0A972FXK8_9FLAO|nr:putative porin [Flavobacterium silvaticum]NMH26706.1 putative porin [Flavobacterium silvaticum]